MPTALTDLVVQHQPMLAAYARALMKGNVHAADDLVQETMLTACSRIDDFRDDGDFAAWLRGIARLKAMEAWRKGRKNELIQDPEVLDGMEETFTLFDQSASEDSWVEQAKDRLSGCLQKLNEGLRSIVRLVYESGVEIRVASARLQISEDAAYQRLSRARDLLRQCVQRSQDS